jgi:hypothetical protein
MVALRPSKKPASFRPCRNACANFGLMSAGKLLRYPITGIAGCCARAASGNPMAAPLSSVMKSRLFIHIAQRVSGDGGDLRFGASGNGELRDAGCAHGRFRNLGAANTRTIPTLTISRSQNRLLGTIEQQPKPYLVWST